MEAATELQVIILIGGGSKMYLGKSWLAIGGTSGVADWSVLLGSIASQLLMAAC